MCSAEGFSDDVMCSLSGRLLQRTQNQSTVTLDQEQKEELFYEVFNEYGDNPIPEY
jgi:negative regulator of genetic competence, sporulation and motility